MRCITRSLAHTFDAAFKSGGQIAGGGVTGRVTMATFTVRGKGDRSHTEPVAVVFTFTRKGMNAKWHVPRCHCRLALLGWRL